MTGSNNPYLGIKHVWVVCTASDSSSCYNYIPQDAGVSGTADWGTATAAWGGADPYKVYGKRVSPLLINRTLNPLYNPNNPELYPQYLEEIVPTWTHRVTISTPTPDLIYPQIELYDGIPEDGAQSVAGIIDGTYYVYVVVFPDANFCYLPRCSGTGEAFGGEICNQGFPSEPYDPNCNPPIYPMDAITAFVPSTRVSETITYNATWEYYNLDSDPGKSNLLTNEITLNMTVYAPSNDWSALMKAAQELTYFYNGIYH